MLGLQIQEHGTLSLASVDIKAIKRIMRKDLVDAGIEPSIYLDQEGEAEKVFCAHCGTSIPDVLDGLDRLIHCDICGVRMHAGCAAWKVGVREKQFCWNCIGGPYISGSVSTIPNSALTMSGSAP